ncbi:MULTISPECIES: phosphoribosylformylglycinamidine synthase [unclassified Granulicatella]|uniref:phosphoribosylformylglycinamidine synthase n=1 Tax=unclassified Granulicatella TaxID=2630493 RepID=UPI0010743C55|nr:phosphoribosylformylglycinamidine synthase [Granulicatella sp. WM01]MBF0779779.1 phosphoribosylformylglycinamidine synthase [Granulicatella sp. 19428wC4_WM01]TFU96181.1 phosphoribosylformylglycinamidine synthase [Granulicatella sp. WM01]
MDKRIFVKKKEAYNQESYKLAEQLNETYKLGLKKVDVYIVYDIYRISEETYQKAKTSVFAEVMVDDVFEELDLQEGYYFAYETLPAQYDQRADSANQCLSLLDTQTEAYVRSGKVIVFDRQLSHEELQYVYQELVNPIESQQKDMSRLSFSIDSTPKPLKDLTGFNQFDQDELQSLKAELSLAMTIEDLVFIQNYFMTEHRDPSETELMVLDCYWSDHCRHTTFETVLDDITIQSELFQQEMQQAFDTYVSMREELNSQKPITLMDMASVVGKYHRAVLKDSTIEVSEEINACSFFTTIKNNGVDEKWLIQFKNETHNHPSEIEPFGGASTCIGGAIRDPLSGRSYVYQAMRISGSGNILQKREETLAYKLPQVNISTGTAHGNSSYGNQIGLATTYVRELYDDSYVAKHMEVGAVVGAVKEGAFKRESPQADDIVILIGGRTGRDGIQGASGSSISHTNQSLETASSQVQKGNAPEERKIQRLFRKPEVTTLIKKCNDFGAGGVCVAIGELAEGIEIHLDKVLVKYNGLNATELATSESQERMAVVIDPKDYDTFIQECEKENIEHAHVATITNRRRLEMYYHGQKVVDMGADFLATSGVRQHAKACLVDNHAGNPFEDKTISKEAILSELASLNVTCQKGLAQRFDSSVGATTVLMPFAGKHQLTPVQASVQALPTLHSTSDTATILTYGFIPKLSHYSPFLSAIYAVLESVAKVYAVGGTKESLYFSFQEYFEKLGKDAKKWGKVTQALLGSIYAQAEIGRPSIGGKDSMSGSFNELNVVETLISFACVPVKIADVITPELKQVGNELYYIPVIKDERGYPNISATLEQYEQVHQYIKDGTVVSAYVQDEGSIVASLVKMALGNGLGFTVKKDSILNFEPASLVVEAVKPLPFEKLGEVSQDISVNGITFTEDEVYTAYTQTLQSIYPLYQNEDKGACENLVQPQSIKRYYPEYVEHVKVVIPVFPGTNCEYDTEKAFIQAGAYPQTVVIRNKKEHDIERSIDAFVQAIQEAHIICFPGGFSSGDEPDGSAKFIVNVLRNERVKEAIHNHLAQQKLILGICNGFQALIKSGLLPYGEIKPLQDRDLTLHHNVSHHHISTTALTRVANTNSPWLQDFTLNQIHEVVFSHGEGRLVGQNIEQFKHLAAFQYCDFDGQASMHGKFNPNGSVYAIEGLISENGLILGKMGHSERYGEQLYKTNTIKGTQSIFANGVNYFKGEGQ